MHKVSRTNATTFKRRCKVHILDFIASENIQTLTANLGFQDNEVIWLYQYFTDIPIAPTTYTLINLNLMSEIQ